MFVGVCHCQACQRRTGSVYAPNAYYLREQLEISGIASAYARPAPRDRAYITHFCPTCGSTVYLVPEQFPDMMGVAVGAFADPTFPPPSRTIWVKYQHPWALLPDMPRYEENRIFESVRGAAR